MKCTICIPTYKRPDCLNNLLSAIAAMEDPRIAEILIGVSYEEKDSINQITQHLLRVFEIQNISCKIISDLHGYIDAIKWFKNTASQDILLIADDDCLINKTYFNLLTFFNDEDVAAVSGSIQTPLDINYYKSYSYEAIDNPDKNILCNVLQVNDKDFVEIKNNYQIYMLKNPEVYNCMCLVGTALFIRKKYLCPDDNYKKGIHYEEFDYTYAAYQKGKKLLYYSGEIAYHFHNPVGGMRALQRELKKKNSDYFRAKWNI